MCPETPLQGHMLPVRGSQHSEAEKQNPEKTTDRKKQKKQMKPLRERRTEGTVDFFLNSGLLV